MLKHRKFDGFLGGEPFPNFRSPFYTYLLVLGYVLALLFILRLAFMIYVYPGLEDAGLSETIKALYIGLRFDARIAAIITFPIGLCLTIPKLTRKLPQYLRLLTVLYFFIFLLLILAYIADFGHYAYLGIRLNAYIFDLMEDLQVAVLMMWQSYPVIPLMILLLVAALACAWIMFKILRRCRPTKNSKRKAFLYWFAAFIIFALAAYGQLSSNLFPLRWSNAYFSPNTTVNALAINPLQNLYDTFKSTKGGGFSIEEAKKYYPLMAAYLKPDTPDQETLSYLRHTAEKQLAPGKKRPNIVIVVMESLAFPKTSFAPGASNPTPELLELAKESRLYTTFYAPTRTTARAMFTTITGIPDVYMEGNTSSRNPFLVDQRVVANEFNGYKKLYMIGGSTSWANIRGVLAGNIDGLQIMEEGTWKSPNMDVWGVSDLDLLIESHGVFEKIKDEPFFAVVQLASFHRPYTIPDNALERGFKVLPLSKEDQENYGFTCEEEYNSLRFSDFAVGEFFRLARQSSYYDNTIFFIFGDHGLGDLGKNMTPPYYAADLHSYHVPMLLHAPGRIKPEVDTLPSTQMDIIPTAASLAGIEFNNYTLGRDLLDKSLKSNRVAFVGGPERTPLRLVQGDYCYYDNRNGAPVLYNLKDNATVDISTEKPDLFIQMQDMTNAFNETARYLLHNNGKAKSD